MGHLVSKCCKKEIALGTQTVFPYDRFIPHQAILQFCEGCEKEIWDTDDAVLICDECGDLHKECKCEEGFQ